jgi:hypothetical protein
MPTHIEVTPWSSAKSWTHTSSNMLGRRERERALQCCLPTDAKFAPKALSSHNGYSSHSPVKQFSVTKQKETLTLHFAYTNTFRVQPSYSNYKRHTSMLHYVNKIVWLYLYQREMLNTLEKYAINCSGSEVARLKTRLYTISSLVSIVIFLLLSSTDLYVSSVRMAALSKCLKCYGCLILTQDKMNQKPLFSFFVTPRIL